MKNKTPFASQNYPASELIINPDGSIYHLNLRPEQLAQHIIAVGDPERVEKVSSHFEHIEHSVRKREFVTHTGYYKGKRITVISSGIGTDNVEIMFNELDALVNIDFTTRTAKPDLQSLTMLRVGTSGSLQENVPIGSLLYSLHGVGLDTSMNFYQLSMEPHHLSIARQIQQEVGLPFTPYLFPGSQTLAALFEGAMLPGNTLTCPGFYAPQGRVLRYHLAFPNMIAQLAALNSNGFRLTNFEMETAGYYGLGLLLGHEVLSLNAIVANRQTGEFHPDPYAVVDELIVLALNRLVSLIP
jgi:uridine phosphorylase